MVRGETESQSGPTLCQSPVLASSSSLDLPSSWPHLDLDQEDQAWAGLLPPGGHFRPGDCQASSRVVIMIPFRDRDLHLATFLKYMHPFLQVQNIEYNILVINQTDSAPFMRGLLFNAGFLRSEVDLPFLPDCYILHDVDHVPERHALLYRCSPHGVLHLAQSVDRFQYQLFMPEYTGGVAAITAGQFRAINGFSNLYIGWGCEDEDFYIRIVEAGLSLVRVDPQTSRYRTLPHVPNYPNWFWDQEISRLDRERYPNLQDIVDRDGQNADRFDYNKFLQEGAHLRLKVDGLVNAEELFVIEGIEKHHSYTTINVKSNIEAIHRLGVEYIDQLELLLKKREELL